MRGLVLPWEARRAFPVRSTLLWVTIAVATALLLAAVERKSEALGAADRSLAFSFGTLLPVLAIAAVLHLAGQGSLRDLGAAVARYGANRRTNLLRSLVAIAATLALVSSVVTWTTLSIARGPDGRLLADILATTPIALASAIGYTAWMGAGACFGGRGAGALVALLADWLAGSTPLPVALATPRGHIRYLLGLEPAFGFPPWVSFLALGGLTVAALALVVLRVPR